MNATKAALLKARVQAFLDTLREFSDRGKAVHITLALAENFNALLAEVSSQHPELTNSLPKHISSTGAYYTAGKAEATYLDVQIYARQLANMLGLLEDAPAGPTGLHEPRATG